MLGWCLGALISTLYAALRPDDGLKNLILLTAPLDFTDKKAGGFCPLDQQRSRSIPIGSSMPSATCRAR